MIEENFIKIYERSFKENWDLPAFTDYGKETAFLFSDVAKEIAKLHLTFEECQVQKGDKIALVGKDCSTWCIAHLAVITYGAVVVPILHDLNPNDIHHIINHSEASLLFVSDRIWDSLEDEKIGAIRAVFSLSGFRCLYQRDGSDTIRKLQEEMDIRMAAKYPNGFTRKDVAYVEQGNEEVVLLNYTSGTTGFSKGVMLTGNNLAGNVTYAR